jgi:hypothetical protein
VSNKNAADDAINAQQAQNRENNEFIREQAAKARQDIIPLYDASRGVLRDTAGASLDLLKGLTPEQIDLAARGNIAGQETLLAGLPQVQNAILGMPVDMGALQTTDLRTPGMLDWLTNAKLPDQRMPNIAHSLSGMAGIQPGMTNQEIAAQAFQSGIINQTDYDRIQQDFSTSGSGSNTGWGNAGASGPLINQLGAASSPNIHPSWQQTLEKLFTGIYPRTGGA